MKEEDDSVYEGKLLLFINYGYISLQYNDQVV